MVSGVTEWPCVLITCPASVTARGAAQFDGAAEPPYSGPTRNYLEEVYSCEGKQSCLALSFWRAG